MGSNSAAGYSTDAWVYRVNMCLFYAGWDGKNVALGSIVGSVSTTESRDVDSIDSTYRCNRIK